MKKAIKHIRKAIRALDRQLERDKKKPVINKYDAIVFKSTLEELLESINEKVNS